VADEVALGPVEDIPSDRFRVIQVGNVEIGVVRSHGRVFAVRSVCPHQGAPICEGKVRGTWLPSRPGELVYGMDGLVVECPWHGYEFSLDDGKVLFDMMRGKLRVYPVIVRDGIAFVTVKQSSSSVGKSDD
jgi:nitrite reductase/ring-hydroxylating ferredoxin subunit